VLNGQLPVEYELFDKGTSKYHEDLIDAMTAFSCCNSVLWLLTKLYVIKGHARAQIMYLREMVSLLWLATIVILGSIVKTELPEEYDVAGGVAIPILVPSYFSEVSWWQ